jgi:glyoxylase-like metal-dependent hydrolase (beta-lactamase superfamily II)
MNKILTFTATGLFCINFFHAYSKEKDFLAECLNKQSAALDKNYLSLVFHETRNNLYHSFDPWQVYTTKTKGTVFINREQFLKIDTLISRKKNPVSITRYNQTELLIRDYGDTSLLEVTKNDFLEQPLENARYSPITLIRYCFAQSVSEDKKNSDKEFAVYTSTINKTMVKLFINKASCILYKITMMTDDELYGDVISTFHYQNYSSAGEIEFPTAIFIEKKNGKVKDTIIISSAEIAKAVVLPLKKPVDFKWKDEKPEIAEQYEMEKFNDHIHFVNFTNADSKSMIVEFSDFLLVAESPLNSMHGEIIIKEARKIAPAKPVRYFVFGHFHPWYVGGVRPFIHKGATVITTKGDVSYLEYLANAPHTLTPDSLGYAPGKLKIKELSDSISITDGKYEMKIFVIGKKSDHTTDYKIFYFPAEQLLFEGDLAWIMKEGELKKAGTRQAGLYNAIKELNIGVNSIVQAWPIGEKYGVKSVMTFRELEESVNDK